MERREIVEEIVRLVEEDPKLASRLRDALLTRELLGLPEHVAALVGAVREMAQAQRAVMETLHTLSQSVHVAMEGIHTLMEGQARLEEDVATLKQDVAALKEDVDALKEDVATLKQDVATLKEDVDALKEDVATLKQDVATLKEGQARLERDVAALKEGQARLEQDVATLKEDVAALKEGQARLERSMGQVRGRLLEMHYQTNAPALFSRLALRLRALEKGDVVDMLDDAAARGDVSPDDADDARMIDLVARGRRRSDGAEVLLAVEVSAVIDRSDVERAIRRAAVIGRAFRMETIPVVAGEGITAAAEASARGAVWRVLDGRCYPPGEPAPSAEAPA